MVGFAHGLRSLAPLLLIGGLVAGCGSEASTGSDGSRAQEPTPTPSTTSAAGSPSDSPGASESSEQTADWPACGAVWVRDANLPQPYQGCLRGDKAVSARALPCSTGVQLITYADRFWGVPGHRISKSDGPLRSDREYQRTKNTCTA
jgi:hypothetical protein